MSLAELLPAIRALPRIEKANLVQLLVDELNPRGASELSDDDDRLQTLFPKGVEFQIDPSPYCFEAARVLLELLESSKSRVG